MAIESTEKETVSRRNFLVSTLQTVSATSLFMLPTGSMAKNQNLPNETITIRQVMDNILKAIPNAPFKETVDTIKAGNLDEPITGIVTTMFATIDVIRKAIELKANFIIAHEPTFYNHHDDTSWLTNDKVYKFKMDLLSKHKIVVWRFHDYIHSLKPDGVMMGVLKSLGWEKYYNPNNQRMIILEQSSSLKDIVLLVKEKLGIAQVRIIGDLAQPCKRIGLMPGAPGGKAHIQTLQREEPDLLICGELQEWETSEYIRDAQAAGFKQSLIVLGHAASEEPGMEWLVSWLKPKVSGVTVTHIPSQSPFVWM
ncbi:MAG TPA: Nif3-like dinuclear metal center hexameric protein [Cyclobacteriaceae bacterium]|jgi:putative NIF3 family GTP cyclohydrolase 1 type 2|nr:Nif3-like dinuclear metal center hexameric protein [Cyclobacteriaceae bacterium]